MIPLRRLYYPVFDPVRREVAENRIGTASVDGRIHPARIEEMVEKAQKEVETNMREEKVRPAALEVRYSRSASGTHQTAW